MFRKLFLHSLNRYISAVVLAIALVILNNALLGNWTLLANYIDGFFIAGSADILVGLLALIGNTGAYDIFSYIFAKKNPNIRNLYEYSESKREKREKAKYAFIPWEVVGIFFLLIAFVLLIVFKSIY